MLLQPDCVPCILTMSLGLLRRLPLDERRVRRLFVEIASHPALTGGRWDVTSPEVIEWVMDRITREVRDPDPLGPEKARLNAAMMEAYGFFQDLVNRSAEPLYTAVKLAICANAIDVMTPGGTLDVRARVVDKLKVPLSRADYAIFRETLATAGSLLYVGDNAGEIVLDKLLIETLSRRYGVQPVYVVRSKPTLNDATMADAAAVGMGEVATVVESGIDGPLPGTIVRRCSPRVRALFEGSDAIVSKGGGNFDSLGEEKPYLGKITFLLLTKCRPYNTRFGVDLFHPVIGNPDLKTP